MAKTEIEKKMLINKIVYTVAFIIAFPIIVYFLNPLMVSIGRIFGLTAGWIIGIWIVAFFVTAGATMTACEHANARIATIEMAKHQIIKKN